MTDKDIIICGHGSGNPSTKNLNTYSTSRYNKKAKNGVRKGIVCVRRPKAMTDALRPKFHDTYKTILGRNVYSQKLRQYVYSKYKDGKYYSDCSSSGCATYNKIGIKMSLLNTAGIYSSNLFVEVPVLIKEGHIQNPEVLKVGDAILFAGDDPSRPKQIGHVEYVYEIKTTTYEVTCNSLYIRKGPAKTYEAVGTLHKGDRIEVKETKDGWAHFDKGWSSLTYLEKV